MMDLLEEVGPTEGAVLALLDFLVDPLLPLSSSKSLSKETVPPSQEELVAKQVHAVVLLYNYYHRKQNPALESLEFVPFCKLALTLKPSLLPYLKLTQREDYAELDDQDKEKCLSLTEKEVMNACDVCRSLDSSQINPMIDDWPITRVAVFLVDSRMENCFLFHSCLTQGVWSAVEKEVTFPGQDADARNKKKRVIKKTPKDNPTVDEGTLLQVAYLAVKEASGINEGGLKILESHKVYSTSKAKIAVRFYIMQCIQSKEELSLIPIKDAMDSLQGPLVMEECGSWIVTPVIEYFHLLPFADKVRKLLGNASQNHEGQMEDGDCHSSHLKVEEGPNPSHHSEAKKEIANCNGSHLKKNEAVLNTSKPLGGAKEVRRNSSHHSKEEKEELLPSASQLPDASKKATNGDCHPKVDVQPSASKLPNAAKEVRNGSTSHLDKELVSCAPDSSEMVKEVENDYSSRRKDECTKTMVYQKRTRSQKNSSSKNLGDKTSNTTTENLRQDDCGVSGSSSVMKIHESSRTSPPHDENSRSLVCGEQVDYQKQLIVQEIDATASNGGAIVLAVHDQNCNDLEAGKNNSDDKMSDTAMSDEDERNDRAIVSFDSTFEGLSKIQLTITSKENMLSQAALKVLFRKRELLSQQLRSIADEIALCDRKIETILNGGEDDLALKIDSVVEGCNDLCLRRGEAEEKTCLRIEDLELPLVKKRKRLSEAKLCLHNPSQELDAVCNENTWTLPTYCVSTAIGGFKASVTVKGVDFECSNEGAICSTPHEARNSAASKILANLRSMATKS